MVGVRAKRQQAITDRRHWFSVRIRKCDFEQRLGSRCYLSLKFQVARVSRSAKFAYDFAGPFMDLPEVHRRVGALGKWIIRRDLALPEYLQFRSNLYLQSEIIAQRQHARQRDAARPTCLRSFGTGAGF